MKNAGFAPAFFYSMYLKDAQGWPRRPRGFAADAAAGAPVVVGSQIIRHDIGAGNNRRVGSKLPTLRFMTRAVPLSS
jgi:hypothetical protein